MRSLVAESSAVLRWLLGAEDAPDIAAALASAEEVVSSAITSAEVGRTLRRLAATGDLTPEEASRAAAVYSGIAAHWTFHAVTDEILARAAQPFPIEPIRTLDAIHLATSASFARSAGEASLLSTDRRVRDNALAMGLAVFPS